MLEKLLKDMPRAFGAGCRARYARNVFGHPLQKPAFGPLKQRQCNMSLESYFILYVADQEQSTSFYSAVLGYNPRLHVPGMSEFGLPGGGVLGLMPEHGVRNLLGPALPDPSLSGGIPRCELYLMVSDPAAWHARSLAAGAKELSPLQPRNWGHLAAYSLDQNGHVLAFATVDPHALRAL